MVRSSVVRPGRVLAALCLCVLTLAGCGGGGGTTTTGGSPGTGLAVPSVNARPVAVVQSTGGAEIPLKRSTSFDGSGSTDSNGDSLTYRWTLASRPAGSTAALTATSGVAVDLTADVPGDYVVTLIVNDGKLDSSPASLTVRSANTAPVADAGADRSIRVAETVVLDGSAQFRHQRRPPDLRVVDRGAADRQRGGSRRCRAAARALRARRRRRLHRQPHRQ